MLAGYRIRRLIGRSRTVLKSKSAAEWATFVATFVVSWFPTILDNVVTIFGLLNLVIPFPWALPLCGHYVLNLYLDLMDANDKLSEKWQTVLNCFYDVNFAVLYGAILIIIPYDGSNSVDPDYARGRDDIFDLPEAISGEASYFLLVLMTVGIFVDIGDCMPFIWPFLWATLVTEAAAPYAVWNCEKLDHVQDGSETYGLYYNAWKGEYNGTTFVDIVNSENTTWTWELQYGKFRTYDAMNANNYLGERDKQFMCHNWNSSEELIEAPDMRFIAIPDADVCPSGDNKVGRQGCLYSMPPSQFEIFIYVFGMGTLLAFLMNIFDKRLAYSQKARCGCDPFAIKQEEGNKMGDNWFVSYKFGFVQLISCVIMCYFVPYIYMVLVPIGFLLPKGMKEAYFDRLFFFVMKSPHCERAKWLNEAGPHWWSIDALCCTPMQSRFCKEETDEEAAEGGALAEGEGGAASAKGTTEMVEVEMVEEDELGVDDTQTTTDSSTTPSAVASSDAGTLDVNGDGKVDAKDMVAALDVNGDGKIDAKDMVAALDVNGDGKVDYDDVEAQAGDIVAVGWLACAHCATNNPPDNPPIDQDTDVVVAVPTTSN